jgi:hypothetical protein
VRVEEGDLTMPGLPGLGFEGRPDPIRLMRALAA